MVNILHISRTMDVGGAERIVYQLASDLKEEFDTVHVASTGGLWEQKLNEQGILHHKILDVETKSPKVVLSNFIRLYKVIKQNNITVIHTHHRMAAFYARILCLFNRKLKHIYTAHNVFFDKKAFYRFSINNAKVISVSKGVDENIRSLSLRHSPKVVYNAIKIDKTELVDESISSYPGVKIGFIGRLAEAKGLAFLINAMNQLRDKKLKLFIAGTGQLESELKVKVQELNLKDCIEFLGYREDTGKIISSCDLMIMPSLFEGLPLTLIEYMAYGKLIIATNINGINEILNEKNGILVQKENSDELAKAISKVVDDPESFVTLSEQASKDYEAIFSYEKFLNGYREVYKQE